MLKQFSIERFGGLRLDVDPSELGHAGAVDLVNVAFDREGRLRTRDGYTRRATISITTPKGLATSAGVGASLYVAGYLAGVTYTYAAYSSTNSLISSTTVSGSAAIDSALINLPAGAALYLANGTEPVRKWDGSTFSSPAGMPEATYLTVTGKSQRLVAAGLTTNPDRVQFSDPGAPETFGADNYEDLPYGGGYITAAETWQDLTFVFKSNRRFFVFYGESIDSTGEPVFNYRAVDGYGAYSAVAGDEGVYFSDGRTIWLTTGGVPIRVSQPIEPYLRGEVSLNGELVDQRAILTISAASITNHRLSYSLGLLYVSLITTGGTRRSLVFDPDTRTWTLHSLSLEFVRGVETGYTISPQSLWLSTAGVEQLGGTADNGTAIAWEYTSGWYDLASPTEKKTRFTDLYGTGQVTAELLARGGRPADIADTGAALALGTAPDDDRARRARAVRGRAFAHRLSGSGPASVSRIDHFYDPPRRAS